MAAIPFSMERHPRNTLQSNLRQALGHYDIRPLYTVTFIYIIGISLAKSGAAHPSLAHLYKLNQKKSVDGVDSCNSFLVQGLARGPSIENLL